MEMSAGIETLHYRYRRASGIMAIVAMFVFITSAKDGNGNAANDKAYQEFLSHQMAEKIKQSDLRLSLQTSKVTYKVGDSISVEALLTNESRIPIYLYNRLEFSARRGIALWFKDTATGKDLGWNVIFEEPEPGPKSKDEFVKLLPEHIFGTSITVGLADLGVVKPGKYELIAEYNSQTFKDDDFGLRVWDKDMGTIKSNTINITVGDK